MVAEIGKLIRQFLTLLLLSTLDNKLIQLTVALIIAVAGALGMAQFLLRYVYGYDIRDGRIRVLLFGFLPIVHFRISEIREVTEGSTRGGWRKAAFWVQAREPCMG